MIESIGIIGGGAWGTALALDRRPRRPHRRACGPATATPSPPSTSATRTRATCPASASTTSPATDIAVGGAARRRRRPRRSRPGGPRRRRRRRALYPRRHAAGRRRQGAGARTPTGACRRWSPRSRRRRVPAVLSGPSFAADVARGLPTAVTIAAADEALALALCHALAGPTFRPYAETDMVGVEIGGAVKNVLAIAAGIVAGRELGASALAALIARGFAELRRLGEAHRRPARHADGPLRPRRPGAHLLRPAVAQLLLWPAISAAAATPTRPTRWPRASPPPPSPATSPAATASRRRSSMPSRQSSSDALTVDEAIDGADDAGR